MTVQQVVPKEDAPIRSKFGMLKELGYFVEEMKLKRKNNTIIDVFLTASKLPDGKLVAFCEDITERKKEHQRLIDSEDKFRQAFAIGPDAFLISTLTGAEIVDVNERFSEMFGYSKQEVIGKSALLLGLWANPSDRTSIALQLKSEGKVKNREIFCKRKNGETFPVILSVSLLQSKNQTLALSVVRDVSRPSRIPSGIAAADRCRT